MIYEMKLSKRFLKKANKVGTHRVICITPDNIQNGLEHIILELSVPDKRADISDMNANLVEISELKARFCFEDDTKDSVSQSIINNRIFLDTYLDAIVKEEPLCESCITRELSNNMHGSLHLLHRDFMEECGFTHVSTKTRCES